MIDSIYSRAILRAIFCIAPLFFLGVPPTRGADTEPSPSGDAAQAASSKAAADESSDTPRRGSIVLAGGCFWCIETDMEKAPGVINVISGYSGGRTENPNYQNYASAGHREVVFVLYDPTQVTFAGLVEYFIKHIDPLDRRGQFNDKGAQYSTAIYYANATELAETQRVIQAIEDMKILRGKIGVAVEPRQPFWPAEQYHQDYHHKNRLKYNYFRMSSGRDTCIQRNWGPRANVLELPGAYPKGAAPRGGDSSRTGTPSDSEHPWVNFRKPSEPELHQQLTALQFRITQRDETEPAYHNAYWNNKREGLYVDVVSGEPLFLSTAKYESGTGWPSFVEPIAVDAVIYRADHKVGYPRIEVRSRFGDSHLGHVFDDGPPLRGGKRYCMNSASLRFVPKDQMAAEGYGEYLDALE